MKTRDRLNEFGLEVDTPMRSSGCPCVLVLLVALTAGAGACSVDHGGLVQPGAMQIAAGTGGNVPISGTGGRTAVLPSTGSGGLASPGQGGTSDEGGAGVIDPGVGTASGGSDGTVAGPGGMSAVDGGAGAGGSHDGGSAGGGTGGGPARGTGGSLAGPVGCADGEREAFVGVNRFPRIAGCAGAWRIAGVLTPASMVPACGRGGGDDGNNPTGVGCSVEDLCGAGWHVCGGASELDALGVSCAEAGLASANAAAGPQFFITRQRGGAGTSCTRTDMTGVNNLHGCGNFGLDEDPNCDPLNRELSRLQCDDQPPWMCDDLVSAGNEGLIVTKRGSTAGGALCCR